MFILIKITVILFILSTSVSAQNITSKYTRPLSDVAATLFPNKVITFENNLMNHIDDNMRLNSETINKYISCHGKYNKILHSSNRGIGNRELIIDCENKETLDHAKNVVSKIYGHEIGHNLKYAFQSGSYVFAVCNYDNNDKSHNHHIGHYACRIPAYGKSQTDYSETFCFDMTWLHRTCNPHKALVATELIPINSRARWRDIDVTILIRNLYKQSADKTLALEMINDLKSARVLYNSSRRGSPDSVSRYPKIFQAHKYSCLEEVIKDDLQYIETQVTCADMSNLSWHERRNINTDTIRKYQKVRFFMERLKQEKVIYELLDGMSATVD